MAAKKKVVVGAAEKATRRAVVSNAEVVNVLDGNGAFIRKYSLSVHGETFRDLANEFAGKEEGRVVEDAE